ncbi:MAG: tetraacyldisaccharide 4'-kinase [Elusimicrobiaceae bacterium]|nr:tetraacyldisaccharide 4'-kinase [Elusimicrobiaceae bacterium]
MDLKKLHKKLHRNALGIAALWIISLFYRLIVFIRQALYDFGFLKVTKVNTRIVCIGNLTTGGTGKTTAVMLAARQLAKAGVRVAIISRGYRRQADPDDMVVLSNTTPGSWVSAGDEPYMLSRSLKDHDVPVIVCANRVKAAQTAVKRFRSQVIVLDDGFQHFKLERDSDIVLIDAKNPFGGDALLPLGTLREPKSALKRARLAVITHANLADVVQLDDIRREIHEYNPALQVIETTHQPEHLFNICTGEVVPLGTLHGNAAAFSAIGDPGSFEETLFDMGFDLKQKWRYPDHHPYRLEDLQSVQSLRGGLPIITTYKDFTKFPDGWREIFADHVYLLSISLNITGGVKAEQAWLNALYPKLARNQ